MVKHTNTKSKDISKHEIYMVYGHDEADYSRAKSTLIKNLIKKTKFENRKKIDDLLILEKFILDGGAHSYNSGMLLGQLKKEYPNEYIEMFQELKPEELRRVQEEERKKKEEREKQERLWKEKKAQLEREKKEDWQRAGGKT